MRKKGGKDVAVAKAKARAKDKDDPIAKLSDTIRIVL
jgi:hypothetical protein